MDAPQDIEPIGEDGIACTNSPLSKTIFPVFMVGVGIAIFTGLIPAPLFLWFAWFAFLPFMFTYSPDFVVYEDGIAVKFPWKTKFNAWDDITKVRKTAINMRLYMRNLTLANGIYGFGRPSIVATSPGRSNYDEAVAAIRDRIPDKFQEMRY